MAMTYASYVTSLTTLMVTTPADANFVAILPSIIEDAEQRVYRELDLLATAVSDVSGSLTANSRDFALPNVNGTFVVVSAINIIVPATRVTQNGSDRITQSSTTRVVSGGASTNERVPLTPMTREFLDLCWPSRYSAAQPQQFARIDQNNVVVGPWPDYAYQVEVVGTIRPTPLSASNTTTFLTTYLPDLFLAASMVLASGYQKNFGSQADDPKMAQSWESHYQTLKASAQQEEFRKKFQSWAWSPQAVAPPANAPRA